MLSTILFAQEQKEWSEIPCIGIDMIAGNDEIWSSGIESSQYLFSSDAIYQFTGNGSKAILKKKYTTNFSFSGRNYWLDQSTLLYISDDRSNNILNTFNFDTHQPINTGLSYTGWNWFKGQFFFIDENHYFMSYNNDKKYNLFQLAYHCDALVSISYPLPYKPTEILSIVVLKDTLYYLSENKLYSVQISDYVNDYNPKEIDLSHIEQNIDNSILLVTDNKNRIWIMNSKSGVIEYDSTTNIATKIAKFPSYISNSEIIEKEKTGEEATNNTNKEIEFNKICLYFNGYLYYIDKNIASQNKVYSLKVDDEPNIDSNNFEIRNIPDIEQNHNSSPQSNQYIVAENKLYKYDSSMIALEDTLYYLNSDGFYSLKVSNNELKPVPIDNITATAENNFLVTNKQNKIWIIDSDSNSIKEYNTSDKSVTASNAEHINAEHIEVDFPNNVNDDVNLASGKIFCIKDTQYFLPYNHDTLYKLELTKVKDTERDYKITFSSCGKVYAPKYDTSIIVLKDTLYYFSMDVFCSLKISDDKIKSNLIKSVTVTDKTSLLLTDKQNRIWIINLTNGIVEYNTAEDTAKTIDVHPLLAYDRSEDITTMVDNTAKDTTKIINVHSPLVYDRSKDIATMVDNTAKDTTKTEEHSIFSNVNLNSLLAHLADLNNRSKLIATIVDDTAVSFYSNDCLYYIDNSKVYAQPLNKKVIPPIPDPEDLDPKPKKETSSKKTTKAMNNYKIKSSIPGYSRQDCSKRKETSSQICPNELDESDFNIESFETSVSNAELSESSNPNPQKPSKTMKPTKMMPKPVPRNSKVNVSNVSIISLECIVALVCLFIYRHFRKNNA